MDLSRRFAPISGDRSHRVELVAAYFALNGILVLGTLLFGLAAALSGRTPEGGTLLPANPVAVVISAVMGCVWMVVAWQLFERRRSAAMAAAVLFIVPLLAWLLGAAVDITTVVVHVVGLLLIRSAWDELEADSWWPRREGRAG